MDMLLKKYRLGGETDRFGKALAVIATQHVGSLEALS